MIYTPQLFSENDRSKLFRFMRRHSFATLLSTAHDEPFVAHLPVLVDEVANTIRAHVARANSLWRQFAPEREVIVIFHGPHHYVSPSWYNEHPSVPTWNYAVVHVSGTARLIEDRGNIELMLRELVDEHEAQLARPWTMDLPAEYMHKMIDGIVAFEIRISRITGKFKLSQNRPPADRLNVTAELQQSGGEDAAGVARLMQEIYQSRGR